MAAYEAQQTIGIVGGGQLGRMLTLAAIPLGFKVVVLNPSPNSPASQVGASEIIGDLYDSAALKKLAEAADYITIEIEHLKAETLKAIAALGKPVNPAPATIELIQDKFKQKEFLYKAGVAVAPFLEVTDQASALAALKKFSGKMLLKTRHGAYDGRGNMVVASPADIDVAFEKFGAAQLYAEKFVPFAKELAVMVSRSTTGEIAVYPIVETIHKRNICVEVLAPAQADAAALKSATRMARKVAKLLNGAGMFGIEMFLTKKGKILINEIAPRVHNSGHYATEACRTSQFEQHIRAVSGLPLGNTSLVVPAAAMVNILGERNGATKILGLRKALKQPNVSVHFYGKSPTKIDRKMGHLTATGSTLKEARARARKARKLITI